MTTTTWLTTLSLVFGGCCSNAISLEHLTAQDASAGTVITLFQFILISLYGLPQLWTKRTIPVWRYGMQVLLFYGISLLNNAAFAYEIPMGVHIIFRSGGLIVSLVLGWAVAGKRYTIHQVLSVMLVTLGVVVTTLSATPSSDTHGSSSTRYYIGICILSLALVLSGFLGLVQDKTYRDYAGAPWQESMFFLHFLGLPLFLPLFSEIKGQLRDARLSYTALGINTGTQLVCVAGVNRLTTRVSALTVTLVLVVRKAVSLVLSVVLNGAGKNVDVGMMAGGAFMVMLGTVWYSYGKKAKKE